DVDGIAVENACEGGCHHSRDTALLNGDGRVLAGGATPEVAPADDDVARPHAAGKVGPYLAETVLGQRGSVGRHVVSAGDDLIGIDVVVELPCASHVGSPWGLCVTSNESCGWSLAQSSELTTHNAQFTYGLGSVIRPSIAEAAAVAGLPR